MKLKDIFKRKNTVEIGQYAKAWVWSYSDEARIYVEILEKSEKFCRVRYVDENKRKFLIRKDSSFNFPSWIPFRDICHLAYDEQAEAARIDKRKSY